MKEKEFIYLCIGIAMGLFIATITVIAFWDGDNSTTIEPDLNGWHYFCFNADVIKVETNNNNYNITTLCFPFKNGKLYLDGERYK